MNKKALIILTLVAVGNGAWAMDEKESAAGDSAGESSGDSRSSSPHSREGSPESPSSSWSATLGNVGALALRPVGSALDGASSAASSSLSAVTTTIGYGTESATNAVSSYFNPSADEKLRSLPASLVRYLQTWGPFSPRSRSMVGICSDPTADVETQRSLKIFGDLHQLLELGQGTTKHAEANTGIAQLRKKTDRRKGIAEANHEALLSEMTTFYNLPPEAKRDLAKLLEGIELLKRSRQLTGFDTQTGGMLLTPDQKRLQSIYRKRERSGQVETGLFSKSTEATVREREKGGLTGLQSMLLALDNVHAWKTLSEQQNDSFMYDSDNEGVGRDAELRARIAAYKSKASLGGASSEEDTPSDDDQDGKEEEIL